MASSLRIALLCSVGAFSVIGSARAADEVPQRAASVDPVVVTAPRQDAKARIRQERAATIINVQSAEAIAKYPDYNAAEALGRVPGVSLSTDTGEGRFVNIRGIDANLNGATYGGVVLLNTYPAGTAASGGGRAVEFDTIPTGAIDGIVVYKTLSPDREAEGLGGQIELTPRSSKDMTRAFVEADVGVGYENLHGNSGPFTGSVAAGARFGFNNGKLVVEGDGQPQSVSSGWISNPTPFAIVVTASEKDDRRGVDDIEPSYAHDGATAVDNVFGEVDFRRYDYHRRRFGYGGAFDFTPNEDHSYYAHYDVAGYVESVHKNHFYALFDGAPTPVPGAAAGTFIDTFQARVFQDNSQETHRNSIASVGGKDLFGSVQVDYHAAYSEATYVEDFYREARWDGPSGLFGVYNANDPNNLVFHFYNDAAQTSPYNSAIASQYNSPRLRQFYENDKDREYSYGLNVKFPAQLIGDNGEVKMGVGARLRDKVVNDFFAQTKPVANLGDYSPSVGASPYFNGQYPNGPYVPAHAFDNLYTTPLTPSLGRDFKDKEDIYSVYAMYTFDVGALGVLAGVRVEQTKATYGNFLTTTDPGGTDTITFVNHVKSYTDAFPTLQFKYKIGPDLQVRATYSTGIARPGFTQAGGNAGVDFSAARRPVYTAGNPNLQPTTGNNFDLDIEYYMSNGGIVQVGVFDKEFKNYIFKHTKINVVDPIFLGGAGDIASFSNESAYARGLEADYHQKFTMLPGLFSGLGLDGNATLVDSRFLEYEAAVSGSGLNEYGTLPGTSRVTWNLAGFYEAYGLNLRLSAEYVSKSLFGLNGDKSLDTIQASKLNLDFTSSYAFNGNLSGYFNVKNLLNTPLRYNEGADNRVIQREVYGQTYEAGVRFKF